jgi:hypothetical protein
MDFLAKIEKYKNTLMRLLNYEQQRLLYPEKGSFSVNYRELTLPILYILLITICDIPINENGWGHFRNLTDISLAANIDRIMGIYRSHSGVTPSDILSQSDFDQVMKKIIQISGKIEEILEDSTKDVVHYQENTELEREHNLEAVKGMAIYHY